LSPFARLIPDSVLSPKIAVLFTDSETAQNQLIFINADSPLTFRNYPALELAVLSPLKKIGITLFPCVKKMSIV